MNFCKNPLLTLALLVTLGLTTHSAFATGGFMCSGQTFSGKKVMVSACMSHSILSLCSDVRVEVNGQLVTSIPRDQVKGLWSSSTLFGVMAYDSEMSETLLSIESFFEPRLKSKSSMKVVTPGKTYRFKDVQCEFE